SCDWRTGVTLITWAYCTAGVGALGAVAGLGAGAGMAGATGATGATGCGAATGACGSAATVSAGSGAGIASGAASTGAACTVGAGVLPAGASLWQATISRQAAETATGNNHGMRAFFIVRSSENIVTARRR